MPTPPAPKKRRARWIVLVLVLVALWGIAAAAALSSAAIDAAAGADAVRDLQADADITAIADGGDLAARAREAGARFRSAADNAGGLLVAPARVLPVIGRQIRSGAALASAAATVLEAGADAIDEARPLLENPPQKPAGRIVLMRDLADIAERAHQRIDGLDLGPDEALLPRLGDGRDELEATINDLLDGLGRATTIARGMADLLDGPRTYILVAANNAEMRAGSGMFLSAATLKISGGRVRLGKIIEIQQLNPDPPVKVFGDMKDRWEWLTPGGEWRNLMLSPRFDASARLAMRMWRNAGGKKDASGIIAIDPAGLSDILEVIGPVRSDGRRIGPGDVVDELLTDQYVRFADDPIGLRRAALSGVASEVFDALNERSWDAAELIAALADSVSERHIMAWSPRERENAAFAAAGMNGVVEQDTMILSILNRGGNKLDPFLDVDATLVLNPDAKGTTGTITIRLRNKVPSGLPVYIAGPNPGHGAGRNEYIGFLSMTLPGSAGNIQMRGVGEIVARGNDGATRMVAGSVRIPQGGVQRVKVRFRMLDRAGSLVIGPSARIPATRWEYGDSHSADDDPMRIEWN